MANVLSQSEINELLNALATGQDTVIENVPEDDPREVKTYDFRTADKFSKEQMRTLHFIYDNYVGRLSTYLSGMLRVICEVEVVSIEEQSFSELSNSMPSPVIVSIASMPPLQGSVLYEITPAIAYEIISRILGGTGQVYNADKAFTEIELSIMERIIRKMLSLMNEAWEKFNKINATLERIETSSQYAQIVSSNEPIAIITMNVKIGDVSDIINLCIPHVAIQPVAKKLVMKTWYSERHTSTRTVSEKDMEKSLSNVYLNLYAVFDDTQATAREIVGTDVGDVIRIDHNINKKITVKVEHIPKFKGYIGMHGKNYAVQVTDILGGEMDNEYTNE